VTYHKYGAKKTTFNGHRYDSKWEATVAMMLQAEVDSGEALFVDTQFKVVVPVCDPTGRQVFTVSHKVDFRRHNKDDTFTLIEAKGFDTDDWKWRRRLLEAIWLPMHPDHKYEVLYSRRRR
jgi:hypothetical protein